MASNTFTDGRLEAFERMMRAKPSQTRKYEPQKQNAKKEKLKKRGLHNK